MPHKDPSEHRPHVQIHKPHAHKPKIRVHLHKLKISKISTLARRGPSHGRRFIEDLQDEYREEEIWILGSGPSMNDYPDNFFDNKTSIGLKCNISIFPNCTFHIGTMGWGRFRRTLVENLDLLKKHIFTLRTKKPRHPDWVPKQYHRYPIYMWTYFINIRHGNSEKLFAESVRRIMKKEPSRYPHEDTISHSAIQAAIIMGAKKITLVGCEEKCVNGNFFANCYRRYYGGGKFDCSKERVKQLWENGTRQRRATRLLAQALKRYGVEIMLYHLKDSEQYKAGYLKLN